MPFANTFPFSATLVATGQFLTLWADRTFRTPAGTIVPVDVDSALWLGNRMANKLDGAYGIHRYKAVSDPAEMQAAILADAKAHRRRKANRPNRQQAFALTTVQMLEHKVYGKGCPSIDDIRAAQVIED